MSTIHQIYCTHCTHGSSALERREGELAQRMLGYSARAGSLEGNDLRSYYRQIERYTYYYLPRDTPSEEKLRLSAATAPQRLVYLPDAAGLQILGQVCYRQTDTQGRPGSYFAHVLFRDAREHQPPWSVLDCLKLWGAAGWTREDSPTIPFRLPALASLGEMLPGTLPAIDDQVVLGFLTSPPAGPWYDPAGIVPPRWRQQEPAQRGQFLAEALGGLLEVMAQQRQTLLLAVEPGVAALTFYAILRLLPPALREQISFSTFEPAPERACTTLAATWFYDPQRADFRPEAFRARGRAINTLAPLPAQTAAIERVYPYRVLQTLWQHGWPGVDQLLAGFQASGAGSAEDLEQFSRMDQLAPTLLGGGNPPADPPWRNSPVLLARLRQALSGQLVAQPNLAVALQPVLGRPGHLMLLELLAGEGETPALRAAVEYLLQQVADHQVAELVRLESLSADRRLARLAQYVAVHAGLPPGCEWLWDQAAAALPARNAAARPLLPWLLARLDPETLERFYRNVPPQQTATFVLGLVEARRLGNVGPGGLTRVITAANPATLVALHQGGAEFFRQYPRDEPALGERLHELLAALPEQSEQFSAWLDVVLAGEHLLPSDDDHRKAASWNKCRRAILELGALQRQKTGLRRRPPLAAIERACRQMAEAAAAAVAVSDDGSGDAVSDPQKQADRAAALRRIGQQLLGGQSLLPAHVPAYAALWRKVAACLDSGRWPGETLLPRAKKRRWITAACVLGALVLVLGIGAIVASLARGPRSGPSADSLADRSKSAKSAPHRNAGVADPTGPAADKRGREKPAVKRPPTEPAGAEKTSEEEAERQRRAAEEAERKAAEAEAARLAEEQATRERERQEEARRAAEEKARQRAEAEAKARAQREVQWRDFARGFAAAHHGVLLASEPFQGGAIRLPDRALPLLSDPPQVFLGAGRLECDDGVYPFGEGFEKSAPVLRHEIPALAEQLGYASVYVELQRRPEGLYVVARGEPRPAVAEGVEQRKAMIEKLKARRQMIMAQLGEWRKWERAADSKEKQDRQREVRTALVQLAEIPLPAVPHKPNPQDPKYANNRAAFDQAQGVYDRAVKTWNDAVLNIPETARQRLGQIATWTETLQTEVNQEVARVRRQADLAREQFKARCRTATAIVYHAGPTVEPGATTPSKPPEPEEPQPRSPLAAIQGEFKVEVGSLKSRPDPSFVAEVKVQLVPPAGSALPRWFKEDYVVDAVIQEHSADGKSRPFSVAEVFSPKVRPILPGTVKAEVRFQLYRSAGDLPGESRRQIGQTSACTIIPVERGKEYFVRFQVSKESLEKLRPATK